MKLVGVLRFQVNYVLDTTDGEFDRFTRSFFDNSSIDIVDQFN